MFGRVSLPSSQQGGYIEGQLIFDEIAFDKKEDVYIDDFMFLLANKIYYPELQYLIDAGEFNGVVGFNRFGFDHKQGLADSLGIDGKANIIRAMINDEAISNYTM